MNSKSERSYKAALMNEAPKLRSSAISKFQREAPSGAPLTQPTKPKPREQLIGSPAPNTPSSSFTTPTNTESSARNRRMQALTPFSPPKALKLDEKTDEPGEGSSRANPLGFTRTRVLQHEASLRKVWKYAGRFEGDN